MPAVSMPLLTPPTAAHLHIPHQPPAPPSYALIATQTCTNIQSNNFQLVQFADLTFPNRYLVDYVRVYQRGDGHVGCDPSDRPTKDFIDRNAAIYNNANISYFGQTGLTWPKNSLVDGCT